MPHSDDLFTGHVFTGDPRNLLTAAFGCTWPTMPGYRLLIEAPNAFGVWALFDVFPVLLELVSPLLDHQTGQWEGIQMHPVYEFVKWDKLSIDTEVDGFEWVLTWKLVGSDTTVNNSFTVTSPRKCNVDVNLPNWSFPGVSGELGPNAKMRQVVWDESEPPA